MTCCGQSRTYWVQFSEDLRASNTYFRVSRLVELPFVPVVGMMIDGVFSIVKENDEVIHVDCCEVKDVYYSLVSGRFDCEVDSTGVWSNQEVFSVQDGIDLIAFGCRLNNHDDVQEWVSYLRARGDQIPETRPVQPESSE